MILHKEAKNQEVKNRRGGIRILFCLLFFLVSFRAAADVVSETMKGKELLLVGEYDAAIALFGQIERDYPASPAGLFGQMAAWQVRMYENQDFRFRTEYEAVEERFEKLMVKMLKEEPASWNLFVAASAYGMRGFYYARDERWFRALGSAIRAIQLLKRVVFSDPGFVDAYLGIGMYNYWRSAMTKDLNFLPFFGDRRAEGIAQIERVIKEGVYAADLSEFNLAYIYTNEKDYVKSRQILNKLLIKYPKNVVLRQTSAKSYLWSGKYDEAAGEFEQVLKINPSITKTFYSLGIVMMRKPGGKEAARRYFEKFLATNPEKEWADAARKYLAVIPTKVGIQ